MQLPTDLGGVVSRGTRTLHIYADGTSGSDANSGLHVAVPKKTIQAAFDLLPYLPLPYDCVIHLSGVFTNNLAELKIMTQRLGATITGRLIIDGGAGTTVVADNAGVPWVADIHTTTSIGRVGVGWVTDAYMGWWVEIVDGVCAGQTRTIQGNTTDTITPTRNWSADPGAAQFRIVRPSTELASDVVGVAMAIYNDSPWSGVYIQRLYFSGTQQTVYVRGGAAVFSACLNNADAWVLQCDPAAVVPLTCTRSWIDPTTLTLVSSNTTAQCGVSFTRATEIFTTYDATINGSVFYSAYFVGTVSISAGSRFRYLEITNCPDRQGYNHIANTAGYAATTINNSAGVGIRIRESGVNIGAGVSIANNTSHGVECIHSKLGLTGAVVGAGNGGAGVYAHSGSVVLIQHGAPPTLTGVVGDLSSDGVLPATTWAAIDGGAPYSNLAEVTMAKEVTGFIS